eukprot:m.67169 g.67169  ORF g.67169 m.67169 type:complete len:315 (+) comp7660_c0_seq1:2127-3071(+)
MTSRMSAATSRSALTSAASLSSSFRVSRTRTTRSRAFALVLSAHARSSRSALISCAPSRRRTARLATRRRARSTSCARSCALSRTLSTRWTRRSLRPTVSVVAPSASSRSTRRWSRRTNARSRTCARACERHALAVVTISRRRRAWTRSRYFRRLSCWCICLFLCFIAFIFAIFLFRFGSPHTSLICDALHFFVFALFSPPTPRAGLVFLSKNPQTANPSTIGFGPQGGIHSNMLRVHELLPIKQKQSLEHVSQKKLGGPIWRVRASGPCTRTGHLRALQALRCCCRLEPHLLRLRLEQILPVPVLLLLPPGRR